MLKNASYQFNHVLFLGLNQSEVHNRSNQSISNLI